MRLMINGQAQEISGATNVAELLQRLKLDVRKIAVEKNREILPRSTLSAAPLAEGDTLEIITFIGGG
jgi:thiamine biosynthesis protein ThiS